MELKRMVVWQCETIMNIQCSWMFMNSSVTSWKECTWTFSVHMLLHKTNAQECENSLSTFSIWMFRKVQLFKSRSFDECVWMYILNMYVRQMNARECKTSSGSFARWMWVNVELRPECSFFEWVQANERVSFACFISAKRIGRQNVIYLRPAVIRTTNQYFSTNRRTE